MQRWGLTLGEPYADVHPGNLVYRCTLRDGTTAVIKSEPERPDEDEFLTGLDALLHYGGGGMVRVLDFDRAGRVVLMELVTPGEPLWQLPIDAAFAACASVMRKLQRPPPSPSPFHDVRTYHRAWPKHRSLYGGPGAIDADLFEVGERLFLELCDTSAAPVVLHGDLHYGNVLTSDREGWLAIDPKGLSGEPCYEVGDLFRNRVDELYEGTDPVGAVRWRVQELADLTGFDRERIRLWALAQAILSEIWSLDEPARRKQPDLRAARLLQELGPLG